MSPEELAKITGVRSKDLLERMSKLTEEQKRAQEAYDLGLYGKIATPATEAEAKRIFDNAVVWMAVEDIFGYQILSLCHKVPCPGMGTMGVCVRGIELILMYDPVFVGSLPKTELNYVITHEVYHIALHHVTCRQPAQKRMHQLANIAMDLAINSIIPTGAGSERTFPRFKQDVLDKDGNVIVKKGDRCAMHPSERKDAEGKAWPTGLAYEEYFAMLLEDDRNRPPPPPVTISVGDIVRDAVTKEYGVVETIDETTGAVTIKTVSIEDARAYLKARGGK